MAAPTADGQSHEGFKPPYISWITLVNFLDKFAENPPPPQIDKSYLATYSGASQALLLATLRTFGLIEDDGTVLPILVEIATDVDARERFFRDRLRALYPGPVQLAQKNATGKQLEEWFKQFGYQGSTLRKAVVFYLNAAEYAGVPKSPHFKPPKATTGGGSRRRRPPTQTAPKGQHAEPSSGDQTPPSVERVTADLGQAGTVTLVVDVRWLQLSDEAFTALRQLTKDLRTLENGASAVSGDRANGPEIERTWS